MARKSLSSQVIEEVDRARGLLSSMQDSADPIFAILLGTALESLNRVETMCIAARQASINEVLSDTPLAIAFAGDKLAQVQHKKPATTRRPKTARKASGGDS